MEGNPGSVFMIVEIFSHETHKSKLAVLMRLLYDTGDVAVRGKHFSEVFIHPFVRVVLNVEVVSDTADICAVLWPVWNSYAILVLF